jgi:hypothetical protein
MATGRVVEAFDELKDGPEPTRCYGGAGRSRGRRESRHRQRLAPSPCRGSNDPAALREAQQRRAGTRQKGWCFNGYGFGRRWVKC